MSTINAKVVIDQVVEILRSQETEHEALQDAKLDALRFRMERMEQGFQALLEDIAANPHSAVERARENMRVHNDSRERDEQQQQERQGT
jgi:hypothetical protein